MMNHAKQANQFARLLSGIASAATKFTVGVAQVFALWLNGSALLNVIREIRFDLHHAAEGPVPKFTTPLCPPRQRFVTVPLRSVANGH